MRFNHAIIIGVLVLVGCCGVALAQDYLTLVAPNGGEEWILGETDLLHFETSVTLPVLIDIDISRDGGGTWETLYDDIEAQTNQGQIPVTGPESDHCLLRVSTSDGALSDISDAEFSIIDNTPVSELGWAAPAAGDTLYNQAVIDLEWTWAFVDTIDVDIRRAGDATWTSVLDNVVCDGVESITLDLPHAVDYELRISDVAGSGATDLVAPLVVLNPPPVLQHPMAGTAWTLGANCSLEWSAPGYSTIDVEISRDGGAAWTPLMTGLTNDGQENWPVTGPMSDHVLLRLRGDGPGEPGGMSGTIAIFDPQALELSETTLDFGICYYDGGYPEWTPALRTFEVSNASTDTLFFIPVFFYGEFALDMTPGIGQKHRIAPGGSTEFSVLGSPGMPGNAEGAIAFFARMVEDDHYEDMVYLSAIGTQPPTVEMQPATTDLFEVAIGEVVDTEVTITNVTDIYTTLSGDIQLGWSNPNFSVISGRGEFSIALGETWTFTVRCAPVEPGFHTAQIDNGLGDIFGGGGIEIMATTEMVFEETQAGTSESDTLYFDNSGTDPLKGNVVLEGASKGSRAACDAFVITEGSGPFELQPGERLTVAVNFAPLVAGDYDCAVSTGSAMCPLFGVSTGSVSVGTHTSSADRDAFVDSDGSLFSDGLDQHALDVGFRDWGAVTREYRGAIGFDIPASLQGKTITDAVLRLYYFDAWGSFDNRDVAVHRITQDWTESTLWWFPTRAAGSAVMTVGGSTGRWIEWDVSTQVQEWIEQGQPNYGFALVAAAGGSIDNAFRFASRQHTDAGLHPELVISYMDLQQPNLRPAPLAGWSDAILVSGQAGTYENAPIYVGQTVYISCGLQNAGSVAAGSHTSRLLVDGVPIDDYPSTGLAAGEQAAILDEAWTFPGTGSYTLRVEMDISSEVAESDETDNVLERVISVVDPTLANLRPVTLAGWDAPVVVGRNAGIHTDELVYPGETSYIHWGFENAGQTDAAAHTSRVFIDGVPWRDFPSIGLVAGAQSSFEDQAYIFESAGSHVLRVEMDVDGDVVETWEADNVYERTFDVTKGGQAAATYLDYLQGASENGDLITSAAIVTLAAHSTYYCTMSWTGAAGPNGGYTGMQSHPDGDLFIFSVWDADAGNPTELEWRAADTQAVRYDNEGSGWATKVEYPWQVGNVYRFHVVAYNRDGRTCISQYVHDVTLDIWKHLAVLSYPYAGHWFRATASFLEDFAPINGEDARHFNLANGWKRLQADGSWQPWDQARFNYSIALSPNENYHLDADEAGSTIRMETGGHTVQNTPQYTTLTRAMPPAAPMPSGTLVSLEIVGPDQVDEEGVADFTCLATWDDESQTDVTALTTWFAESPGSFAGTELDPGGAVHATSIAIEAQADILSTTITAQKIVTVIDEDLAGVGGQIALPQHAALHQNWPNPFNPSTAIVFDLPEPTSVKLEIFDLASRRVRTLLGGEIVEAGRREVIWDGTNQAGLRVATGVYFYRLEAGVFSQTKRMLLLK